MKRRASAVLALALLAGGLLLVAGGLLVAGRRDGPTFGRLAPSSTFTPRPTLTEPILPPPPTGSPSPTIPLALPSATVSRPATLAVAGEATTALPAGPGPTRIPQLTALPVAATATPPGLYSLQERMGVGSGSRRVTAELAGLLGFGWYLDWRARADGFHSADVRYMPMIRLRDGQIEPFGDALLATVDELPGALWLVGNEPDVKWQDNVSPEAYAQAYHDLYALLKGRDPTCQVAIGGVSQPTPLRLRYLDRILEAYRQRYGQEMPVDVWNVHNFVLREERGSWGVDVPPGMDEDTGRLYEIDDHDDLALFRQQLVEFRRWMAERGQQDKPLIVTEYGILMPGEYGFPPEAVRRFMLDTFELMRTLIEPALGYPADGGRLVQRWCWFSLQDERYPTGDLVQPGSGQRTSLGEAFAGYVSAPR